LLSPSQHPWLLFAALAAAFYALKAVRLVEAQEAQQKTRARHK